MSEIPEHAVREDDLRKAVILLSGSVDAIADAFGWSPEQMILAIVFAVRMYCDGQPNDAKLRASIAKGMA